MVVRAPAASRMGMRSTKCEPNPNFHRICTEPNLFERRLWIRKKMKCEALQLLDGGEGPCGKQYGNAQHEVRAQSQLSPYLSHLVLVQRPIHQFFPKRTDFFKFIEFKGRICIFCNPHQNIRRKMLNHFISNYLQHQT